MENAQKPSSESERTGFWNRAGHKLHDWLLAFKALVNRYRWLTIVYKLTVALIGTVIIVAGIAMLVLPGPGWLTIFFGLAILGTEFTWARKLMLRLRQLLTIIMDRWRRYRARKKLEKEQRVTKK